MDAGPEVPRHLDKAIRRVCAIGAGAEGDAIGGARHGIEQLLRIGLRGVHARQAEEREGRVIRVDGELDADFLCGL